ncbi:MAG: GH25 family lysozyme [Candidatus Merdivicinus sp.]|jgi:lysozyme
MRKKTIGGIVLLMAALLTMGGLLVWKGVWIPNRIFAAGYPVQGVDVSSYQGEIDWEILAEQHLSFAYLKATEGSSFVDPTFARNAEQARKTNLRIGAYHFFSYDSPGSTQAENFIRTVQAEEDMLPPVVDLEFYGDKEQNPPAREDVRRELTVMLRKLEEAYGVQPVIYATQKSYTRYLSGEFAEYGIWIRNVYTPPLLPDGREWTFWQYTDRDKLAGYQGEEPYIDRNVFCGSPEEFSAYPEKIRLQ